MINDVNDRENKHSKSGLCETPEPSLFADTKEWFVDMRSIAIRSLPTNLANSVMEIVRHSRGSAMTGETSDEPRVSLPSATLEKDDLAPDDFLSRVRRLDEKGETDTALDVIFDQLDEMLLAGEFNSVNNLLESVCVENYSVEILLGILTATLPAKTQLAGRAIFFNRTARLLRERDEFKDGLLAGLD